MIKYNNMAFQRLFLGLIKLIQKLLTIIFSDQLKTLIAFSDPINSNQNQTNPQIQINHYFAIPILFQIITPIVGIFGLEYEAASRITFSTLRSSPFIFTHQVMPSKVWSQFDICVLLCIISAIPIYGILFWQAPIENSFKMRRIESKVYIGTIGKGL